MMTEDDVKRLSALEQQQAVIVAEQVEIKAEQRATHEQITINTAYSFGIDDQEFVVSFECDEPADFHDLATQLGCA